MSDRNTISRTLAAYFARVPASAGGIITGAIVLSALRVLSLMEAPSATASYAVAFCCGGLLLIGAMAVKRGSQEPRKRLAECKRVRARPLRYR